MLTGIFFKSINISKMYVIKPKDGQKQKKQIQKKFNNNKYGDDKIKSSIRETLSEQPWVPSIVVYSHRCKDMTVKRISLPRSLYSCRGYSQQIKRETMI